MKQIWTHMLVFRNCSEHSVDCHIGNFTSDIERHRIQEIQSTQSKIPLWDCLWTSCFPLLPKNHTKSFELESIKSFPPSLLLKNDFYREEDAADASLDPEPIMIEEEEAFNNPACQAILAEEVGLAFTDFQDDRLRKGYVISSFCPKRTDSERHYYWHVMNYLN